MKDKSQKNIDFISLQQASSFCDYSQEYLGLRARQGKLKAVKMGRNWVTKKEWLDEYIKKVGGKIDGSGILHFGFKNSPKEQKLEAGSKFGISAYISLHQAASQSRYSLEYLSLRARQGKLRAIKIGRNWVTTKEWLADYMLHNGNGITEKSLAQAEKESAEARKIEKIEKIKITRPKVDYRKKINDFWERTGLVINPQSLACALPIFFFTFILSSILVFSFQYRNNIKYSFSAFLPILQEEGEKSLQTFYNSQKQITWQLPANLSIDFTDMLGSSFLSKVRSLPGLVSFYGSHDLSFLSFHVKSWGYSIELLKDYLGQIIGGYDSLAKDSFKENQKRVISSLNSFSLSIKENIFIGKSATSGFLFFCEEEIGTKTAGLFEFVKNSLGGVQDVLQKKAQNLSANFFQTASGEIWSSLSKSFSSLKKFFQQKVLALFNPVKDLAVREKIKQPNDTLPRTDKINQGMVVIPSSDKDEEIKKKIQNSFSDEVKVMPKDENSGIVVPVFKEREGSDYLYIMVPVKD